MREGETIRKFAPATAAAGAFELAVKNSVVFARAVGGWIGVQVAAQQAGYWGVVALLGVDEVFALWFYGLAPNWQQMIVAAPLSIVTFIAGPAMAVNWHRFAVLGESPRSWVTIHVRRTALYVGRILQVVGVVAALSVLLVPLILVIPGGAMQSALIWVVYLLPLAIAVAIMAILVRTGLAFPAAAVDDRACTLQHSWNRTEGNSWRLLGGLLLVALPFYVANGAVSFLSASDSVQQNVALSHFFACVSIGMAGVGTAILAGYYSAAYSFLIGAKANDIAETFK
jgi:hypothetical protein